MVQYSKYYEVNSCELIQTKYIIKPWNCEIIQYIFEFGCGFAGSITGSARFVLTDR